MTDLEVQATPSKAFNWTDDVYVDVVAAKYRPEGTRRWTRFNIVCDEEHSISDGLRHAREIAQKHYAGEVK